MNYTNFLKRAWHTLWHYPALWVFGFLLALTGSSGGSGGGGGGQGSVNYTRPGSDFYDLPDTEFFRKLKEVFSNMEYGFERIDFMDALPWIILGAFVILVMVALSIIIRNLALTANYKMVDHYETSGEKVSWKQGFRWGWSRKIWQLFLMDLVVGLPLVGIVLVLLGCAFLPFILIATENGGAAAVGIVSGVAMLILFVLLTIVIGAFVDIWLKLAKRLCVLDGKGVFESLGQGWGLMRSFWKDVLIMWLIMIGVQIAFGIVLIPVAIILLIISGLFGFGVGFAVWALSQGALAAIITGFVLFILVISLPMTFVSGLGETYYETVWTLLFRETKAPSNKQDLPELPETPQPQAA